MLKRFFSDKDTPFWLFTFTIAGLLTLPRLVQDGMFLDGMLYTCVSHNLSKGIGTFWLPVFSPTYSNSGSPFFLEHPPLVFGIQSVFYKIFGDSMYVERLYIFLTMCFTAYLIYHSWQIIFRKDAELKKIGWLPILLWITIPSCSWSYSYNMMENTLGLFGLAAVLSFFIAAESDKNRIGLLILSGFFVFLATFSKGIPGLFPLSVPFLYWLTIRKKGILNTIFSTSIILSVPVVIYFILFNLPQSKESLTFYVTNRLMSRIQNDPTVSSRLNILLRLVSELIPQISFVCLVFVIAKIKRLNQQLLSNTKYSMFFLLAGLSASAPLVLTMVQRGFYLVPSFPYFGIGLSIIAAPFIDEFKKNLFGNPIRQKSCFYFGIMAALFTITFTIMQLGKSSRDKEMLHDVYSIGKVVPVNSAITVTQDIASTYVLECYFIRYYNIGLFTDVQKDYYMIRKNTVFSDNTYEKLNIETKLYDLYKRK
jgi:hypothetical protein